MSIIVETNHFYLKSVTPKIINDLYNSKTKEEVISFFGFDEDGFLHYKKMHENGIETHNLSLFYFLLISKETNLPIGNCGFHSWNTNHDKAELFYNLNHESDKRKGYLSEVLPVVLKYGFNDLKLHRIKALVGENNIPSIKLLVKNAFVKEGVMREDYLVEGKYEDSVCYSLLKNEWLESKI